ncbi:MAG TPA: DCC1-like thiol-disulfide oxidoreductase family protein [Thermoplasmata archaeon]|nr:DCC1-like thiol-disulfide oxidoreductase family protein [Thermoplasmata archaeon]
MPYAQERAARLYYDDTCGSCGLFARSVAGLSHHRVDLAPLASPAGEAALGDLPTDARFAAAHLVDGSGRRTGAAIVAPLVGLTLGRTAGRLVDRFPVLVGPLRWAYRRLWAHRQRHGCAAPAG